MYIIWQNMKVCTCCVSLALSYILEAVDLCIVQNINVQFWKLIVLSIQFGSLNLQNLSQLSYLLFLTYTYVVYLNCVNFQMKKIAESTPGMTSAVFGQPWHHILSEVRRNTLFTHKCMYPNIISKHMKCELGTCDHWSKWSCHWQNTVNTTFLLSWL